VVVEAEQGTTGASGGNVIKGTYNYGSKISIDCWLDTSKQYTVKKCYGGYRWSKKRRRKTRWKWRGIH
jgi:hypothetical protein